VYDLRNLTTHTANPSPAFEFTFCKGNAFKLLVVNLEQRGGSDLLCLHKGSRAFTLMASVSLTSLSPSGEEATTKGHLGGFCENSEDILMAGGDFDGDGLADLACR